MNYFNYNGKLLENKTPVFGPDNRSFRYGDGIFETIKYRDNELILFPQHMQRLWKGMKLLQFEITEQFTHDFLRDQIIATLKKNKLEDARIRLAICRGDGGIYDPSNHHPNFVIQCWPLSTQTNLLNENGLLACIYEKAKKPLDDFSNLKHNSYLPYYMAALFAKKNRCNDAIVLNQENRICDSTIANIFIIKDETISTPALSEGCIEGIMRNAVIECLTKNQQPVQETKITREMLLEADEVFLTNSILDIKWIGKIGDHSYKADMVRNIAALLSSTNTGVFC